MHRESLSPSDFAAGFDSRIIAIAMVAQRYRLKLVPGHPIEMKTMATMRPRHGGRMTLHAR